MTLYTGKELCSLLSGIPSASYYQVSVAPEDVARVYLPGNVIEARVVPIGHDGLRHFFKLFEVVDHKAAEESGPVFECRLVDDDLRSLGLDAFHHALDG